jgi:hypothetical protein
MKPSATARKALTAVGEGRLSMEETLSRALASTSREFSTWLKQRLGRPLPAPQRVQIWSVREVDDRVADAAIRSIRKRFGRQRNITSIHWGVRRQCGRPCAENCVVVHCVAKKPRATLGKGRRLPRLVRVRVNGHRYAIPVDVQAVGALARPQSIGAVRAAAGRPVWRDRMVGPPHGTLGALVQDGQGQVRAVLSGHVAGHEGRTVLVGSGGVTIAGQVAKVVQDGDSDIAWTTPLPNPSHILTRPPALARDPTRADLRTAVTVLVTTDFRGKPTFIEGVGVSANFSGGGMAGLTALSPQVTVSGDSGSPVLDANGDLIGFVVGVIGNQTLIVPARSALNDLER